MDEIERTKVAGIDTVCLTRDELADVMVQDCLAHRNGDTKAKAVFSSNGQGISLHGSSAEFAKVMSEADMVHADGQSVVFASKLFTKKPLPERVATTDFFHNAAQKAQEAGLSFYMLGASEDENKLAYENIQKKYPELKLVGRRNGYFTEDEMQQVLDDINQTKPDVLWVALGKPKQEFWCIKYREQLNVGWIKTCGGLYAFLAGTSPRAPQWMQNFGLEWLFRVYKAPTRLGWRYLTTNPHAFWLMITKSR